MKIIWLIKTSLNETYNKFHIGKYFSDMFPIQNGIKRGDALMLLLSDFALKILHSEGPGKPGRTEIKWDTSVVCLCQGCKSIGRSHRYHKEKQRSSDTSKANGL
jgi:hypothetical protein